MSYKEALDDLLLHLYNSELKEALLKVSVSREIYTALIKESWQYEDHWSAISIMPTGDHAPPCFICGSATVEIYKDDWIRYGFVQPKKGE